MSESPFYVYLLASKKNGTLYTGVTRDLTKRTWEHKTSATEGFTSRYDVKRLVFVETHPTAESAITREKQIKKWNRAWKLRLIEAQNPNWEDSFDFVAQ